MRPPAPWAFDNPSSGTQHFVFGNPIASVAVNTLLLYDRLFSVTKTMNSSTTEAVTGVPTRYQSTTAGAADSAANNFPDDRVPHGAGCDGSQLDCVHLRGPIRQHRRYPPSVTGNSSNIINRLDQPAGTWFCPLASDDTGIKNLTQMQCSAAVATGRSTSPSATRSPSCPAALRTSCARKTA